MIYLDNGATTIFKPQSVAQAVYRVLSSGEYGNPSRGAYHAAVNASEIVYETRQKVARLFNVPSNSLVVRSEEHTSELQSQR